MERGEKLRPLKALKGNFPCGKIFSQYCNLLCLISSSPHVHYFPISSYKCSHGRAHNPLSLELRTLCHFSTKIMCSIINTSANFGYKKRIFSMTH